MTLEELQKDEAFQALIEKAESYEEVIAAFKSKGVEVTEEQLRAALEDSDELDAGQLEEVAGGLALPRMPWPRFPRIPGIWPPKRWPRW